MKGAELSIIAPCFNEEGNVRIFAERVLRMLDEHGIAGELILVNDGSRDNTQSIIESLAQENHRIKAVHHITNKGLAAGWRTGLANATGGSICIIDSDLQYQPEEIPALFNRLKSGDADVVQGYRNTIHEFSGWRFIMSRALSHMLNLMFSMKLLDNKSGFFVTSKAHAHDILHPKYSYRYFQILVMVAAARKGLRISEIKVQFKSRQAGKSFMPRIPFKVIFGCLRDLAVGFFEYRLNKSA